MPQDLKEVVVAILSVIRPLIAVVAALSVLVFFRGLAGFIFKAGDTKAIEEGKQMMKWGLIALFVMMSVWGILRFFYGDVFGGTFGLPLLPPQN